DRDHVDGTYHVCVHDLEDSVRRLDSRGPQRTGHMLVYRSDGELRIQLNIPPQKIIWIAQPQDEVRVCDRWLTSSLPVACRAWLCAGRPGTHLQHAARVDVRNTASSGPHGVDVYHRQRNLVARDLSFRHKRNPVVLNQAHIEARASHVGDDEVWLLNSNREAYTADCPSRRTGKQGANSILAGCSGGSDPTVTLEDLVVLFRPFRREVTAHVAEITG